jgi:tRNA dimethylallyltransferase
MTIGTVPTTAELTTAPHHFIQNKSIFENYTVGEFEEAVKKIDDLFLTDDYVILVGGSGLYVNAILKAFDFPEINNTIREAVNMQYEKLGLYIYKSN